MRRRMISRPGHGGSSKSAKKKAPPKRAMQRIKSTTAPAQVKPGRNGDQIRPGGIAPDDLQARIRDLTKLAKEQGYVTFDDLNDALPEAITDAEELDAILAQLRRMEIDIIEASEVDRYRDGKKEVDDEEEEDEGKAASKVDILDDPVRMYLKQMGQVPLLTRDQEVEISKRIEEAEAMVQKYLTRFGFVARGHLDLARKLLEGRERFDRVILDKKIESRERYMKNLPRLCKQVEKLSVSVKIGRASCRERE